MEINGTKVVDATKPVVLHITAGDIKAGDNKNPSSCAAARCIMREFKQVEAARVHLSRTYVKTGKRWVRYMTGRALRSEIVAFDRGGSFEPGEYYITPMTPSQVATGKRRGSPDTPKAKRRKPKIARLKMHATAGVRARGAVR